MVKSIERGPKAEQFGALLGGMMQEYKNGYISQGELSKGVHYSILDHLKMKLNGTAWNDMFWTTYNSFMEPAQEEDDVTRRKISTLLDELLQAYVFHDGYHISYALFHYLHMREGLGRSRKMVRKMFPNCEKLSKVPEVHEFYLKRRGEKPTSMQVLKDFMALLEWLDSEDELGHIQ
ncbi:hypothetical protein L596_025033 [Steinernema carpocapsae]|uniref:Uncharacterized protein n=1 Tax=Steinernema carpocapsae TaxID=34508 RepID=A0A4U5M6L7_STECR|nr:hypothetical protein L596_025033 [Steinernema carpocapsae]